MKKSVLSLAALIAVVVAGCGSTPPPAEDRAEPGPVSAKPDSPSASPSPSQQADPKISIANIGYAYDAKESYGTATVMALVENPSTEKVAVNVDFTAYDKAGKVLAQTTEMTILGAKKTGATGTHLDVGEGANVGRVTAEPDVAEHEADNNPGSVLVPSDVEFRADEYGSQKVTGKITNKFKSNLRDYRIDAVCFKGDKIVGGGFTFADFLHRSGTERAADVDVYVDGKPDRCDLYGSIATITETE